MKDFITRFECSNNHLNITKTMDGIKNELENIKLELAKLPEKLAEKFDERYASKLTQKIVYGLVGMMVVAVIVSILTLVIQKKI